MIGANAKIDVAGFVKVLDKEREVTPESLGHVGGSARRGKEDAARHRLRDDADRSAGRLERARHRVRRTDHAVDRSRGGHCFPRSR